VGGTADWRIANGENDVRKPKPATFAMALAVIAGAALTGCGGGATTAPAGTPATAAGSTTVAPESNPAGDIPDSQVFVPYRPPSKLFVVSVPEGWAQRTDGSATVFTDKLNSVRIETPPELIAPTVGTVRRELPALESATPGYRPGSISIVDRNAGPVILATYGAASPPNPVTGKAGVDAVERYYFWRDGHEVILTLSGPVGADNVDPWRTITDSLQWQ
jgi:hypothetical protein